MKKDKLKIYVLELFLVLFLMGTLFSNRLLTNKIIISIFLVIYAFITKKSINSIKSISVREKEVRNYMIVFAIFYLIIYYLIGYYVGYYRATYQFGIWVLMHQIIPIILIIISSEILRKEFLSAENKSSLILTFIFGVLVDLVIYTNIYNLNNLQGFLEAVGYVFFASIASNLLYNYISINFGIKSNIIYRIIITIYLYIIPITPDVHMYFKSFARIVYPIIILLVLVDTYEDSTKALTIQNRKVKGIVTVLVMVMILSFTMLISCRFRYGLIVVGSNSMKNALEKGDVLLFDSKNNNIIEGQVVLFKKDNITVIHRIVRIEETNGIKKIYTKGDNNPQEDSGYITYNDLRGVAKFRIKKMGLLTIWVNELF